MKQLEAFGDRFPGYRFFGLTAMALMLLTLFLLSNSSQAAEVKDSCTECHSNRDFMVTNKKLYNYFQEWELSIHRQEEVSCDDCHGGNSKIADKTGAHGESIGSKVKSAVSFINIPDTCGQCHDEIYEGYRKSPHFEHLVTQNQEKQGPNCVTCHSSINSVALNVNTVKKTCVQCHNKKTKNHPEIPEKAEWLLNKFLSIHRFYRYVSIRGEAEESKVFLQKIDAQIGELSIKWHTFDLDEIEQNTRTVLDLLKDQRNEIKKQIKQKNAN
ncbi:MAG: cytochrome c3 family protein [SAR324 cluster bacterium]|nr:cytochrome c3 family protein [SAR324 cluster bacterium]